MKKPTISRGKRSQIAIINDDWKCICGGVDFDFVDDSGAGHSRCIHCSTVFDNETGLIQPDKTPEELLCEAINALKCEFSASYEYPGFVSVGPRDIDGGRNVEALRWAWGYSDDGKGINGNDEQCKQARTLPRGENSPNYDAMTVVQDMRWSALRRASYLNDLCEKMTVLLEETVAASPDQMAPWWKVRGMEAYTRGQELVNEWRQH